VWRDAAQWFVGQIYPRVRAQFPGAEFWIVGANPAPAVRQLATIEGVKVTGTVPDIRPYLGSARVFVAPFRFGGGTKLKVLEAMAMGLPVVATSVGCQGIPVNDGIHLLLRDSPEEFAAGVVALLKDSAQCEMLGANARQLIETKFSWEAIVSDVEKRLSNLGPEGKVAHFS